MSPLFVCCSVHRSRQKKLSKRSPQSKLPLIQTKPIGCSAAVCGHGSSRCGSLGAPPGLPGLRPACYGSSCCQVAQVPLGRSHQTQPWSCSQWEAVDPAPANGGQLLGKLGRDVTGPAPPSSGEDNSLPVSERRVWM